ncbi:MAG: recombinase family protein [Lachnospiraceae bacterium]|nr:recombinase family protein [Lachnospiraceae bacterium]
MEDLYGNRKGKKCVIYIRVSSERQVQGYSLEGQKRYLKEWAEFEGMCVSEIYVEPGKSGKSISGRDVFQKMLEDISTGRIKTDFVVVFKLSRFGRNAKDILNSLTYIQNYGVNLICKEDGLDSSTAMGRMMITILGAVAEMERENILAQTMLGREEKAKQGGWNGGFAPYGYELVDSKLLIKDEEALIVKLIFDKFVNGGMGYSTIAGYLNRQGVARMPSKNSHGRAFTDWNTYQVKRILDNPIYTGRIAFGRTRLEKITGTDNEYRRKKSENYIISENVVHTPIIDEELFEKAKVKRNETSNTRKPKVGRMTKHLLSGILKCPMCNSSMYAECVQWTNKDGVKKSVFKYQCGHYAKSKFGQCKKNAITAAWVETEVIEYTKLLIRNPKFAKDIQKQIGQKVDVSEIDVEIENYKKQLNRLENNKSNLERDIDGILDEDRNAERKRKDMNVRLNKIYDEIYDIEDRIADCELKKDAANKNILTKEKIYKLLLVFDKIFDKMNGEERRRVIESLISEVHLHPKDTWEEGKNPIKDIKYTFPVDMELLDTMRENLTTVETVVLMSKVK